MRELDELFSALGRSSFRRKFRLNRQDGEYLARSGLERVLAHGREFIEQRLAAARPTDDGRPTPLAGHPVFVAQHATGTCCRKCLQRWHGISRDRALAIDEFAYILSVLRHWLERQPVGYCTAKVDKQGRLFAADG